jgi:predicted nucleic acid-binding protein
VWILLMVSGRGGPLVMKKKLSSKRAQGRSHKDADVLIAAHASHYGAVIVTANPDHFQGTGASVENWDEASR